MNVRTTGNTSASGQVPQRRKDALFTKEKQNELLKLQTEFETERRENENKLLKTQNLNASLELERNRLWLVAAAPVYCWPDFFYTSYIKTGKPK